MFLLSFILGGLYGYYLKYRFGQSDLRKLKLEIELLQQQREDRGEGGG